MNLQFARTPHVTIDGDVATTRAALLVEIQAPIGKLVDLADIANELTKEFYGEARNLLDYAIYIVEHQLELDDPIWLQNLLYKLVEAQKLLTIELIDETDNA